MDNTIIGIDLGTGNSCVSVYEGSDVIVIPNSEGKRTTPSIVAYTKDGEIKVGDSAKRQAVTNPKNTIYSVKRLMGKSYDQIKHLTFPYEVINSNGRPAIKINDKQYSPEEISATILQKMKKTAEDFLGRTVTRAVITVPAYFGDDERSATRNAGEIAGLKVERIINEPTAAALAYGIDKSDKSQKILVFDCGSGTHDVSVLDFGDGVFEVLATDGNVFLGGDNVDEIIINWIADEFLAEHKVDLRKDPMALQRIKEAAEKAKIELSNSASTDINLPYIMPIDGIPQHLVKQLSKSKFEQMIDGFIKDTMKPVESVLQKAGVKKSDINEIVMMGGSTRIPKIVETVEAYFGKKVNKSVNPDEGVAIGACIQGGVISGKVNDILLLDVTPIALGIETMGGVFTKLVDSNTTIPVEKTQVFSTAADNQPSVEIHVLQGERALAKDNKSLGRFNLDGIPMMARGVPQIEVKFSVDANSILTVSAVEKSTNKQQTIRIDNSNTLSKEEIERMKNDAKANEESDKKLKEEIEKLNTTDNLIFSTEKFINENKDKISASNLDKLNNIVSQFKKAKESKDLNSIDSLTTELNTIMGAAYTDVQNAQNNTQNNNASNTSDQDTDPKDAEDVTYEEVK